MPRYRFTWEPFDNASLKAFAEAFGWEGNAVEGPYRQWLTDVAKGLRIQDLENDYFFDAVRDVWLPKQSFLEEVVEELILNKLGPGGSPRSRGGYAKYLQQIRRSPRAREIFLHYLRQFGDSGPTRRVGTPFKSGIENPWRVEPSKQVDDPRKPHDYQREAWDKLSAALARHDSGGDMKGLLVMPTGSGKTFTAVRWLVERIVNRGGRVLWLAHRRELLEQATRDFQRLACFARGRDLVRGRLVGGGHASASTIGDDDDVVVSSIAMLARHPEIRRALLKLKDLHVVIDEAHHAPAKSYRDLIIEYKESGGRFLLGLTATPTRTMESERPDLSRLFGSTVIHQVDQRQLIERGILARPVPVHVSTGADAEAGVTAADRKHLAQFHELSEDWLKRIAKIKSRNEAILQHYLANRKKYGKTIVFAINVAHAETLKRDFAAHNVSADYVASYRPDNSDGDPSHIIDSFRNGELDVLINVQMLTEGVDVPDVQTVFLARPTASEILVRQMIGRALRGPSAGGTEKAYLVSFEDHWERYREWQSPLELVEELADVGTLAAEPAGVQPKQLLNIEHVPHDLIHAVLTQLRQLRPERPVQVFEAIPAGHYVLESSDYVLESKDYAFESTDADCSERRVIAVFEHQVTYWQSLVEELALRSPEALQMVLGTDEFEEVFEDCDAPKPPQDDIDAMIQHFAQGGIAPAFQPLTERERFDPRKIAMEVRDKDLGLKAQKALIDERYSGYAKAVYPSVMDYHAAINDALEELEYGTKPPITVNFVPRPEIALKDDKSHDLTHLMNAVLITGSALLQVPKLPMPELLLWSRRPIKSWWGHAAWQAEAPAGQGRIRINCILNSSDVSDEALKFLLWHEFLHLFLKQGHTKAFRATEKLWPNWQDADREIDRLCERFDIRYW